MDDLDADIVHSDNCLSLYGFSSRVVVLHFHYKVRHAGQGSWPSDGNDRIHLMAFSDFAGFYNSTHQEGSLLPHWGVIC